MQQQAIKITRIQSNTGQIEGLPKNPRFIKDEKYQKLLQSIKDDPEMLELRELLVYPHNKKFVTIAGNVRLMGMIELGYTEAICKVLPKETTVEKLKAIAIKDNVSFGEHDWKLLTSEWDSIKLKEWALDLPDPAFLPNYKPVSFMAKTTGADMDNAQDRLNGAFADNHIKLEVHCPECAHKFFIDKK